MTKNEARRMGYHPCKYCNKPDFQFDMKWYTMRSYAKYNHMKLAKIDKSMYVKTEIGIWKMVYKPDVEKYLLYHGNKGSENTPLEYADRGFYHRQKDLKEQISVWNY
ncbi:MAG: hypothetical protein Q4B09_10040 [Lachnospiraceae bacterium]|nr:hypothetical protein [Lachnospiraceae bacterium]